MKNKTFIFSLLLQTAAMGAFAQNFSGGDGSAQSPYQISSIADMSTLATNVNANEANDYNGKYFQLANNLDFSNNTYTAIGSEGKPFNGIFDGNGKTISGITINKEGSDNSDSYQGVFGLIGAGGEVHSLTLSNSTITGYQNVGGIAGCTLGKIRGCHVLSNVTINAVATNANKHGGVVGQCGDEKSTSGEVAGCVCEANVSKEGTIDVTEFGGIVGWNKGNVHHNLFFDGEVTASDAYAGAIAGWLASGGVLSYNYSNCEKGLGDSSTQITNNFGSSPGYSISSGTDGLILDFGTPTHTESVDHFTAYNKYIPYNGKYYTYHVSTDNVVSFTSPFGIAFHNLEINYHLNSNDVSTTINGSNGVYSFVMPAADVTITAETSTIATQTWQNAANNTFTSGPSDVKIEGRTFMKNGNWNTLCLPFALSNFTGTPLAGATVMELTSSSFESSTGTLILDFKEVSAIDAGIPYIVKWANSSGTLTDPVFKNVDVTLTEPTSVTSNVVSFNGCFSPIDLAVNDTKHLYLGTDNNLYYPNAAVTVNSFRAYFTLLGNLTAGEAANVRQTVLHFGTEETGITDIHYSNRPAQGWYDLNGRRLTQRPAQKGIYIIDGKKRVIK